MKPLAFQLRPQSFKDVVGQDHLVGPEGALTKLIAAKKIVSFILAGNPGTGKTTIAIITAKLLNLDYYHFNASTDNKAQLKEICDKTIFHDILIIVDEIQRMKSDTQDYLLPFLESGKVKIIGITTENPYVAVNPAIRSRCHIYEVADLKTADIEKALINLVNNNLIDYDGVIKNNVYNYLAMIAAGDLRSAINMLEIIVIYAEKSDQITLPIAKRALGDRSLVLGKEDLHDILSAFQKAIRGSDVNASLHYLARLIALEDLASIVRRLLVIVYEDIGLANPLLGVKVKACCDAALQVGFPEARIPLSVAVIDAALSPKSNTAFMAIEQALERYKSGGCGPIPKQILNREILKDPTIYKLPHDYKNSIVNQQYLPDNIKGDIYYQPKAESSYETALKKRLEALEKAKATT
ncbi:MAG: AAA family ATPase [Acholeplasmataceae bacterium]|jgi:putative ATPase|nr:AAA family ATPase [Acholeplasmataceae bacterium]